MEMTLTLLAIGFMIWDIGQDRKKAEKVRKMYRDSDRWPPIYDGEEI